MDPFRRTGQNRGRVSAKKKNSGWGGAREGAGRPKTTSETVPHLKREPVRRDDHVHIVMRIDRGLPTIPKRVGRALLEDALEEAGGGRGFKILDAVIVRRELHLLCKASSRKTLARAMQGFSIRMARAFNRHWDRAGRVWSERYGDTVLRTKTQVREARRFFDAHG